MALGNVKVNKAQGVGQPINGKDHYTGFMMYVDMASEIPTGWGLEIYLPASTHAEGTYIIDVLGSGELYIVTATGDAQALNGTAATDVTAGYITLVNDLQEIAEAYCKLVTVANMEDLGIVEGSNADKTWYQLKYFFEKNPNGFVWVCYDDIALGEISFDYIDYIVLVSNGDVRKVGIYGNSDEANFSAAHTTALQVKYDQYAAAYTPLEMAYFPLDFNEAYGAMIDLKDSGNSYGVWVVNAWDWTTGAVSKWYPAMGVVMGNWAISKVSESIGHVRQYDFISSINGSNAAAEYDKFGFRDTNGLVSWATLDGAAGDLLDGKGWNFFRKYVGISGTYLNDMSTVSVEGNDFDKVFFNVTLDKISRNVRTNLLPEINSEIIFNGDGTLRDSDIHRFSNLANTALAAMESAGELSAYETVIDRTQDVASTGILYITVNVVLNGVAKSIIVSLARVNALG